MRLSVPSQRLVPALLIAVLAVAFVALVATRLTGGGSGEGSPGNAADADKIVQKAFSTEAVKSGRFDGSMNVSVQVPGADAPSTVDVSVKGAFDASNVSAPKLDMTFSASGGGQSLRSGVVMTGEQAFVELNGRTYQFPRDQFDRAFRSSGPQSAQQTAALFRSLGVNPRSWLVNPTKQGTVTVDGVPTTHVRTGVDVNLMLDDFYALARRSGTGQISRKEFQQAKSAFTGTTVDLYVANSDGALRKFSGTTTVQAPGGSGSGNVKFGLTLHDVNKPQKITAPSDARSFGGFEQALSRGLREQFGNGGRSSGGSAGHSGSAGGGNAAGGAGAGEAGSGIGTLPPATQQYLRCVQRAAHSADLQQCAPLLN
jgi:hypothetical protein